MVCDIVLGRIGARARVPCYLAVGGQDVIDAEAGGVDEVSAVLLIQSKPDDHYIVRLRGISVLLMFHPK